MPIQVDIHDIDELEYLENYRKSKKSNSLPATQEPISNEPVQPITTSAQKVKSSKTNTRKATPALQNTAATPSETSILIDISSDDDDDDPNDTQLQKPKVRGKPGPKPDKQYTRTEKQKEVTNRMREKLKNFHEEQRKEKEEKQAAEKKRKEEKILAKAISIKKKQIKKEAILDEVSDDDSDIEEIKEIIRRKKSTPINIPKPIPVPIQSQPQPLVCKYRFL